MAVAANGDPSSQFVDWCQCGLSVLSPPGSRHPAISPHLNQHLRSYHLSLPRPFTAVLKVICFTNLFDHSHSGSFLTAFNGSWTCTGLSEQCRLFVLLSFIFDFLCVVVGCNYVYCCSYQPCDWLTRLGVLHWYPYLVNCCKEPSWVELRRFVLARHWYVHGHIGDGLPSQSLSHIINSLITYLS